MDLFYAGCGIFWLYHAAARKRTTEQHLPQNICVRCCCYFVWYNTIAAKSYHSINNIQHTVLTFKNTPPFIYTIMPSLSDIVPAGVVTGDDLYNLFEHARANGYAIPAVNCTRSVMWSLFFSMHCVSLLRWYTFAVLVFQKAAFIPLQSSIFIWRCAVPSCALLNSVWDTKTSLQKTFTNAHLKNMQISNTHSITVHLQQTRY